MSHHQAKWYVVFTKPRQERLALLNLERQGLRCFLPMASNPFQKRRRRAVPAEPLFPRYLFVNANPRVENLAAAGYTRGVTGLVRAGLELLACPEEIVAALMQQQDPRTGLIPLHAAAIREGDRVRVFDGPLAGLCGVLKTHCSHTRALLLLRLLGRETTVEVDSLLLQRAS